MNVVGAPRFALIEAGAVIGGFSDLREVPCSAERIPCSVEIIPCSSKIIPCSADQGIPMETREKTKLFRLQLGPKPAEMTKIPCSSLIIREFGRGEQFASDCVLRHTAQDFRVLRGKIENREHVRPFSST